MKLRARREARLKAAQSSPLSYTSTLRSDGGSIGTYSTSASTMPGYPATAMPTSTAYTTPAMSPVPGDTTEVDFSPSVRPEPAHPVPLSFNDGATLDWGTMPSDDDKSDRKWPLHLRRKHKARGGAEPVVEQQDSLYAGWSRTLARPGLALMRLAQINSRESKLKLSHIHLLKQLLFLSNCDGDTSSLSALHLASGR